MDLDSLSKANEDRRDAEEDAVEDDNDNISEEEEVGEVRENEDENEVNNDDEDDRRTGRMNNNDEDDRRTGRMNNNNEDDRQTGRRNDDDEDDERAGKNKGPTMKNKFAMTFRDVEDSIRPFTGDEKYPVARWIVDFEEAAELFGWTDMQKMIFAKKSLRGLAKLFIQGERGLDTWKKLKRALKDEFSDSVNSAELHRQMDKKKIKKDESVRAYFLVMKEIAARGKIEEEALFQYVIDGIDDQSMNKSILYGAENMKEFKEKLKIYEKVKTKSAGINKASNLITGKKTMKPKEEVRCFNCGELGHKSTMCESKNKGTKCFRCNEFGHKSIDCKKEKPKKIKDDTNEDTKKIEAVNSLSALRGMYKMIEIKGEKLNALVQCSELV
ncbi:uncharacterized protein [Linepithema humile]|uniref:uncharacterized protein n=1 Tax=Linepithema humile TaxID=83485 RepID=UPI00351ED5F8